MLFPVHLRVYISTVLLDYVFHSSNIMRLILSRIYYHKISFILGIIIFTKSSQSHFHQFSLRNISTSTAPLNPVSSIRAQMRGCSIRPSLGMPQSKCMSFVSPSQPEAGKWRIRSIGIAAIFILVSGPLPWHIKGLAGRKWAFLASNPSRHVRDLL